MQDLTHIIKKYIQSVIRDLQFQDYRCINLVRNEIIEKYLQF
jgi:hypothetical protein